MSRALRQAKILKVSTLGASNSQTGKRSWIEPFQAGEVFIENSYKNSQWLWAISVSKVAEPLSQRDDLRFVSLLLSLSHLRERVVRALCYHLATSTMFDGLNARSLGNCGAG